MDGVGDHVMPVHSVLCTPLISCVGLTLSLQYALKLCRYFSRWRPLALLLGILSAMNQCSVSCPVVLLCALYFSMCNQSISLMLRHFEPIVAWSAIGMILWSVCLSVCPWCCALWLNDTFHSKSVWSSEEVNRKCPPKNTTLQHLTPYNGLAPWNISPFVPKTLVSSGE